MQLGREAEHSVLGDHAVVGLEVRKVDACVRIVEHEFGLRMIGAPAAALLVGLGAEPQAGLPQEFASRQAPTLESPDPDQVFDRGPFPIGGDTDTPMQTAMQAHDPYDNKAWSPSFRQIVDMGDLSRSVVIHPPGQSGQLASQYYDDLAQLWLNGEYHPMLWTRDQVEAEAIGRLLLKPKEIS